LLVPLRDLDPVEAAPLTDAGLTPYHAISRSLPRLRAGSSTLVIGAGGLGHIAVQILGEVSATTIVVVDQRADALELAASVGAHHNIAAGPDAAAQVVELTHDRGTDLVLDFVGTNDTIALGIRVARADSVVTVVGMAGGGFPFSVFSQRYAATIGSTYWGTRPELVELLALAEAGRVRAHVQRFALADAPRAYAALAAGELTGRAVIVPD
jgi:propanol-preferring alcohol dehydrogenase